MKDGADLMTDRYAEIDEVIAYIHNNIYEPLPLSALADYIGYSPYHFHVYLRIESDCPIILRVLASFGEGEGLALTYTSKYPGYRHGDRSAESGYIYDTLHGKSRRDPFPVSELEGGGGRASIIPTETEQLA